MKPSVPERVADVRLMYDLRDYIAQDMGVAPPRHSARYIQVRCPFHADADPSLAIYERNYYCHGCKTHGDIVDWVRHRDGSDFFAALEMLEGRGAPVARPKLPPRTVQPQPDVQDEMGQECLRRTLKAVITEGMAGLDGSPAQRYCVERGWGRTTQTAFSLGHLDLHSADLVRLGGVEPFEEMGLLYRTGHPWFSRRLLIPLFDPFGEPVALATRVIESDAVGPRYINSRRSSLFKRNEMIYGAHVLPRSGMGYFLIVEGYADVWSLHRIGVPAIAIMSDRMTDYQFDWVVAAAQTTGARIVLAFDGDSAGQEGERLSYARLAPEAVRVSRLSLRGGTDVSDIIETDGGRTMNGLLAHIEGS